MHALTAAGLVLWGVAQTALAQDVPLRVPSLAAGYAQMINVTLSEDLSAADYRLDESEGISDPRLQVARAPWRFAAMHSAWGRVDWELQAGYLQISAGFPLSIEGLGEGRIDTDWTAYGLTLGVIGELPLSPTLSLEPSLRAGVARLENQAHYTGVAELLRPYVQGTILDWDTYSWIVSPSLALTSRRSWGSADTLLKGHVAHSWVVSFGESDPAVAFREGANAVSLRGELERPLGWSLAE